MKRKTEDAHHEIFGFGLARPQQFLRSQHALERVHQRGQLDGQRDVMQQPAQILQRVRHTLQEMRFALVKSAKAISAQRLHDAT